MEVNGEALQLHTVYIKNHIFTASHARIRISTTSYARNHISHVRIRIRYSADLTVLRCMHAVFYIQYCLPALNMVVSAEISAVVSAATTRPSSVPPSQRKYHKP